MTVEGFVAIIWCALILGGAVWVHREEPITLEHDEWTCTRYAVPSLATEPVCIQFTRKEHV